MSSDEPKDPRRRYPRSRISLALQLYHSKAKRRLARGVTLNVGLGGVFAQWDDHGQLSQNQVVRIHLGPPAETWPALNGFLRGRIERIEEGEPPRCALKFLGDPPLCLIAPELVGGHACMVALKKELLTLAAYDVNVLIRGESGTGKNVVAFLLHRYSARSGSPFVLVNLPTIPDSLLESQLFGHEKGAFTDAGKSRPGLFRVADKGSVVLDEISTVPFSVQAKLLQAIEEKSFLPIGSHTMVKVDVRLLATSNDNLEGKMRDGTFREDLFYRLTEMTIVVPPLRERATDVLILSEYFLRKYCRQFRREYRPLDRDIAERFLNYTWPGNVRELENTIKRGVLLGQFDTAKTTNALSPGADALPWLGETHSGLPSGQPHSVGEARSAAERNSLVEALSRCQYDRTRTAAYLGVSYRTLLRWLKKHRVQV